MIKTIEILVILAFIIFCIDLWRRKDRTGALVIGISLFFVTSGEIMNAIGQVAIYPRNYLIMLPLINCPLYIILGGAELSLTTFSISRFGRVCKIAPFPISVVFLLALSMFFPMFEHLGIKLELWFYREPSLMKISLGWYIGVWKFYFIFIAFPALIGLCLEKKFERHKAVES